MGMNLGRHLESFKGRVPSLLVGAIAEFYLETIKPVFQEYALPQGRLQGRGRTVNPAAIHPTALLT